MRRTLLMLSLLFVLGLLLGHAGLVQAATCTATQCTFDVTYVEPSTYADGSPMTTLTETTVYYGAGAAVLSKKVPASKPQGGGTITTTVVVTIPINATKLTAVAQVSASISNGPESPRSAQASTEVFFTTAPTGLTIR